MMQQNRPMPSQAPMTYQDSVQAITGKPRLGVHYNNLMPQILAGNRMADGAYNPALDMAVVNRYPNDQVRREWVYAHEMGHRLEAKNRDPLMVQAFDSARAVNPAPDPVSYAATSRDEHFAEAFANAITELRDMNAPDIPGLQASTIRSLFRDAEGHVPGTMAIMQVLMKNPLYAQHPLQPYKGMMGMPYQQLMHPPLERMPQRVVSR